MRYLTTAEYESVLLAGLKRYGLDEPTIHALLDARWPMCDASVLVEAQGRGLSITMPDVQAWLDSMAGPPLRARECWFNASILDQMLAWLVAHGRAQPTLAGELMQERPRDLRKILQVTKAAEN